MLKVSSYCKHWKKNSQVIPSKNKHGNFFSPIVGFQYILQNSVKDGVHFSCQLSCSLASGKLCILLLTLVRLLLALWRPGFVSHLYLPWPACLAAGTLLAPDSFGSLQPGEPKSPVSFLLEEECKLQSYGAGPSVFHCFSIAFTLTMCVYKFLLKIFYVRTG